MPGFLPGSLAKAFTIWSGGTVDFSRFGRTTVTQGLGHYNLAQIADRAYILGSAVAGAAAALFLQRTLSEEPGYYGTAFSLAIGFALTGFAAHEQVTRPRRAQRAQLLAEIEKLQTAILALAPGMSKNETIQAAVAQTVDWATKLSAASGGDLNLTWTYLQRKRALEVLFNVLTSQNALPEDSREEAKDRFWTRELSTIQACLKQATTEMSLEDIESLMPADTTPGYSK